VRERTPTASGVSDIGDAKPVVIGRSGHQDKSYEIHAIHRLRSVVADRLKAVHFRCLHLIKMKHGDRK